MHKLSTLFHLLNYYSIWTKTERVYISIRYINSEQIPRFSHESRFEFLSEIDRRAERERLNPCPHSLLSYPLFRVETTRIQREDYRNRINRCFPRNC